MQSLIKKPRRALKKIAELALEYKSDDSLILFFDEGRFGMKPDIGRQWALKGSKPITQVCPGYKNFYIFAAVSPISGEMFSLLLPYVNTVAMNVYLDELHKEYSNKKILLVMDRAGWHLSGDLKVPHNITIAYLPPYSPELNPAERLWQWLRRHICRNRLFDNLKELEDTLSDSLKNMKANFISSLCNTDYLLQYK